MILTSTVGWGAGRMAIDGEILRMVMVLHDIRDYAHGYVDQSVRLEINRTLDEHPAPDELATMDLRGILLALASEAETFAGRLIGRPNAVPAGPLDALLATLASRCRSAIAAAG